MDGWMNSIVIELHPRFTNGAGLIPPAKSLGRTCIFPFDTLRRAPDFIKNSRNPIPRALPRGMKCFFRTRSVFRKVSAIIFDVPVIYVKPHFPKITMRDSFGDLKRVYVTGKLKKQNINFIKLTFFLNEIILLKFFIKNGLIFNRAESISYVIGQFMLLTILQTNFEIKCKF